MTYSSYVPDALLQPYIERYWLLSGCLEQEQIVTLMPDGGINLVLNLGEDISSLTSNKIAHNGNPYIVGTMTQTEQQVLHGKVLLFGIIFKPGAFTYFYRCDPLSIYANQFQEFDRKNFPDVRKTIRHFLSYVNRFYLERLSTPKYSLLNVVSDIVTGQPCEPSITAERSVLKIDALAKKHFTTERQLERQFNKQIGISPKEFINLIRFTKAFAKLQRGSKQTLSTVAWEFGYYDHAHLTNDFKRYTGKAPTEFFLSDFSKAVTSDAQ